MFLGSADLHIGTGQRRKWSDDSDRPAGGGTYVVLDPVRELVVRGQGVQDLCLRPKEKTGPPCG